MIVIIVIQIRAIFHQPVNVSTYNTNTHSLTYIRGLPCSTKGMSETTIYACSIKCFATGVFSLQKWLQFGFFFLVLLWKHKSHINSAAWAQKTKSAHNHKLNTHSEFSCKYPSNYKFSFFFRQKKMCSG